MKRLSARFILVALTTALIISTASAQSAATDTLIRNATVLTITRRVLTNTDVLIHGGKSRCWRTSVRLPALKIVMPPISSCRMLTAIRTQCSTQSTKEHLLLLQWCNSRCYEYDGHRSLSRARWWRYYSESSTRLSQSDWVNTVVKIKWGRSASGSCFQVRCRDQVCAG